MRHPSKEITSKQKIIILFPMHWIESDPDAFLSNKGRLARLADNCDNEIFRTKGYLKITRSIEYEGFYAYD